MFNWCIVGEMCFKWVEEWIQILSKEEFDVIYYEYGGEFKDEEVENKYLVCWIVMEVFKLIKKVIDYNCWMNINV